MSDDSDDGANEGNKGGGRFPDAFRKAVVSGMSALFVTEENVRNIVSDLRLPKDAMSYVVQQTEKTRREMFRVVAHEVKGFLRNADVTGEMRRALNGLKVQVRAEIKFSEDDQDVAVKSRVKRKKRRGKSEAATGEAQSASAAPRGSDDAGQPAVEHPKPVDPTI